MSIVELVAAFTVRSINDGDNNIVSIKLEVSGIILLSRGHHNSICCSNLRASSPCQGKLCFLALKKLIQVLISLLLLKTIFRGGVR